MLRDPIIYGPNFFIERRRSVSQSSWYDQCFTHDEESIVRLIGSRSPFQMGCKFVVNLFLLGLHSVSKYLFSLTFDYDLCHAICHKWVVYVMIYVITHKKFLLPKMNMFSNFVTECSAQFCHTIAENTIPFLFSSSSLDFPKDTTQSSEPDPCQAVKASGKEIRWNFRGRRTQWYPPSCYAFRSTSQNGTTAVFVYSW